MATDDKGRLGAYTTHVFLSIVCCNANVYVNLIDSNYQPYPLSLDTMPQNVRQCRITNNLVTGLTGNLSTDSLSSSHCH